MKLTINRITLLFGSVIYLNCFVFGRVIPEIFIALFFGVGALLGIRYRKSDKPYTYGRGLLIGIRIWILGIIYSLLFLIIVDIVTVFIASLSATGVSIITATQEILILFFSSLPSLIALSIFSLALALVIPIYFLRKSKLTDDIIDADLMDNQEK